MGVHGLWELLAPVGRRVSVETLAGRKLAIDASIWMVQFMKAMRDEKGEMVRNAHVLGFFRRICKLLFLRTKPVFVFDGGTPALKRRTVAARRRHRDDARAKIRKTAEKLLLNHLKAKKLEELAQEIKRNKLKDDPKGKQVMPSSNDGNGDGVEGSSYDEGRAEAAGASNLERLDELLAASLAAEEENRFTSNEPVSAGNVSYEEDDDGDEDEEMILPVTGGNIDPTVLASLPPSMQLDLLVQMRERLMAENRQKYQKIKKAPAKFSELQIQSYLKTVAFRREINEVQKCAAGRGLAGVQASRIASEANREFIFSSSYTGDKQKLMPTVEKNVDKDFHTLKNKQVIADIVKQKSSTSQSQSTTKASSGEIALEFGHDVETYYDERGRVRVSRLRGLGMRLTRDLQRNLDLMKEYEQEKGGADIRTDPDVPKIPPEINHSASASVNKNENNEPIKTNNEMLKQKKNSYPFDEQSVVGSSKATLEISFSEDDEMKDPDDIFMQLASGSATTNLISESANSEKITDESEFECMWEEVVVEEKKETFKDDKKEEGFEEDEVDWEEGAPGPQTEIFGDDQMETHKSLEENDYSKDVEWEEGAPELLKAVFHCEVEYNKPTSRGSFAEEAEIQEAIKRSLEDLKRKRVSTPLGDAKLVMPSVHQNSVPSTFQSSSLERRLSSKMDVVGKFDGNSSFMADTNERLLVPAIGDTGTVDTSCTNEIPGTSKQSGNGPDLRIMPEDFDKTNSNVNLVTKDNPVNYILADDAHCEEAEASESNIYNIAISQKTPLIEETMHVQSKKPFVEKDSDLHTIEADSREEVTTRHYFDDDLELVETNLDKEISQLNKERLDLGDAQRRLERNAESVSSEMFAECQELLQMFGLPYIIAPMEAEAQCAYMEMANLVDGVVTDDSDVFLFGARNVYKNIFDDRKYVETYFMKDIESDLGLSREKLIQMALLLGSDYTEGVSGIGIVNAIEVVHAFPEENGFQKFREWVESPDPDILGKFDSSISSKLKKRASKSNNKDAVEMGTNSEGFASERSVLTGDDNQPSADHTSGIKGIFMNKHRNVSKNWHLPSSFPSESVVSAYISPQVDESTDTFAWGKPDLLLLRRLCWERFAWNTHKADELLLPVLNEYNKHETQLRLEAFYTFNERFAKIRSQRIKKALKGITVKQSSELMDDHVHDGSKSRRKRKLSPSAHEECKTVNNSDKKTSRGRKASEPSVRRKAETDGSNRSKDVARDSSSNLGQDGKKAKSRSSGSVRGRGRGRGAEELKSESTGSSSGDESNARGEIDERVEVQESTPELRRSTRNRKHVRYSDENVEADESGSLSTHNDIEGLWKAEIEQKSEAGANPNPGFVQVESDDQVYLFSGGGFCADEDDETQPQPAASSGNALFELSQEVNEFERPTGERSPIKAKLSSISGGLSAMPLLKRKRK